MTMGRRPVDGTPPSRSRSWHRIARSVESSDAVLDLSTVVMVEQMERIFLKLRPRRDDPPPLPPQAAAAAPAVPVPMDIPKLSDGLYRADQQEDRARRRLVG